MSARSQARPLSRRQTREMARVGSWWDDGQHWWRISELMSADRVALKRYGADLIVVTLRELAGYVPTKGEW